MPYAQVLRLGSWANWAVGFKRPSKRASGQEAWPGRKKTVLRDAGQELWATGGLPPTPQGPVAQSQRVSARALPWDPELGQAL